MYNQSEKGLPKHDSKFRNHPVGRLHDANFLNAKGEKT